MVKISFPDGSVKEFDNGITGLEIAKSISSSLAKKALAVVVNGELEDLNRAIEEDAELKWHKQFAVYFQICTLV